MKDLSEQTSICEAIRNRKSCRAYLDQDVSLDIIEKILEAARWAPSGVNHQPTHIAPDFNILAKKIRPSSLQIPSETLKKAVSSFCSA